MKLTPLRVFFRLAFGITWGVGALGLLLGLAGWNRAMATGGPLPTFAGYGPTIAGLACAARYGGWRSSRRLLAAALPNRSSLAGYPVVLLGYPAMGLLFCRLSGASSIPEIPWESVPVLLGATLATDSGPLGEEFGWRGFALPILLARLRPIAAATLLGIVWAAWHLPTFFIPSLPQSRLKVPLFVVSTVALSLAMTAVYIRNQKLDLMVLCHLVGNFWSSYLPFTVVAATNVAFALLALPAGGMFSPPIAEESKAATQGIRARTTSETGPG